MADLVNLMGRGRERSQQMRTLLSGKAPMFGYDIRSALYPGESSYFAANPNVAGMAAETGDVILNPYATGVNSQAVAKNEALRLLLRDRGIVPDFDLTEEQIAAFRGTAYESDPAALKATIAARIYSGDPSAKATPQQTQWLQQFLMQYGLN